jgi:alkylhydroperoxidase family enzyme
VTEHIDELRAIVAATPAAPPAMALYLAKVADRAHTVTDADVEALTAAGCSEDEIFEQTVAAAIAQGLRRLDAAARAIG